MSMKTKSMHGHSRFLHAPPHSHTRHHTKGGAILPWVTVFWLAGSLLFLGKISMLQSSRVAPQPAEVDSLKTAAEKPQLRTTAPVPPPKTTSPKPKDINAEPPPADKRTSGLGPTLDTKILRGGWTLTREIFDAAVKHENATVVSWESPRIILIRNFLSPEEVHQLITGVDEFARSEVVSDSAALNDARTSYGAWLNGERRSPLVHRIQHRIYEATRIPEEFGESLYLLRYAIGQNYHAHTDHCSVSSNGNDLTESCRTFLKRGGGPSCGSGAASTATSGSGGGGGVTCGDRLATMILYLQSPEQGGATVFPHAKRTTTSSLHRNTDGKSDTSTTRMLGDALRNKGIQTAIKAANDDDDDVAVNIGATAGNKDQEKEEGEEEAMPWYCKEDADVLKVLPSAGDAVLFWDYVPSDGDDNGGLAVPDPTSLHAGCPPLKGTKFIATRWMRAAEFH